MGTDARVRIGGGSSMPTNAVCVCVCVCVCVRGYRVRCLHVCCLFVGTVWFMYMYVGEHMFLCVCVYIPRLPANPHLHPRGAI